MCIPNDALIWSATGTHYCVDWCRRARAYSFPLSRFRPHTRGSPRSRRPVCSRAPAAMRLLEHGLRFGHDPGTVAEALEHLTAVLRTHSVLDTAVKIGASVHVDLARGRMDSHLAMTRVLAVAAQRSAVLRRPSCALRVQNAAPNSHRKARRLWSSVVAAASGVVLADERMELALPDSWTSSRLLYSSP